MLKYFLFLSLFLLTSKGYTQDYLDIFRVSYALSPETSFDNGNGRTQIEDGNLALDVPIPLSKNFIILTGINAHTNAIKLYASDSELTRLWGYSLPLGVNVNLNEKWGLTVLSFFKRVGARDIGRPRWQLGGATLIQKKLKPGLNYSFGVFANDEEYGVLLVPLFGLYYLSPSENFEASLLLPSTATLDWRMRSNWHTGILFDGLGSSYPVNLPATGNGYVQKMSNELSAYLRYDLSKSLLLQLRAGYALFRSYRLYDQVDQIRFSLANIIFNDPREVRNNPVSGGMLFSLALKYRLHFLSRSNTEVENID